MTLVLEETHSDIPGISAVSEQIDIFNWEQTTDAVQTQLASFASLIVSMIRDKLSDA